MKRGLKNCLLGLLGFSAAPMLTACYGVGVCEFDQSYEGPARGYVVDENVKPIKGIKVSYIELTGSSNESKIVHSSTVTDEDGAFTIEPIFFGLSPQNGYLPNVITLQAEDIDGEDNGGSYATQTRRIEMNTYPSIAIVMAKKADER